MMVKKNAQRFLSWFTTHPWLKLIALILAILLWLYIKEEIKGI